MTSESKTSRCLREMELEVLEAGREWTRRRLEQRLQEERAATAEFFPLSGRKAHHRRSEGMGLRPVVGSVQREVWHGQEPQDQHWGGPIRERWGLAAHQRMSPALEGKPAFRATLAGSSAAAALVAGHWGRAVDEAVRHALVQRVVSRCLTPGYSFP